jgi:hypothetical protein
MTATTTDKITFSSDVTTAQTSANLSEARYGLAGVSDGSTKGFAAGGINVSLATVATGDKITFSTDTTSAVTTSNLSQARQFLGGMSSGNVRGYFTGGQSSAFVATTDRITYSTETTSAFTVANISKVKAFHGSLSDIGL